MTHLLEASSSIQAVGLALFEISLCSLPPLVILGKLKVTERRAFALLIYVLVCCWAFIPTVRPLYSFFFSKWDVMLGVVLALAGGWLYKKFRRVPASY